MSNKKLQKNGDKINKLERLRKNIKNFLKVSGVESLYMARSGIKVERRNLDKFTQEEIFQAAKKITSKAKKVIVDDFIKFLFSQKGLFVSRPDYVNIRFKSEKKYVEKINHLIRDGYLPSFRSFIIAKLKERFGLEKDFSKFSVRVKDYKSAIKSNQLLLPSDMFFEIWKILETKKSRKLTKSHVRKIISSEIENILAEYGN
jgi:hypothetical protein